MCNQHKNGNLYTAFRSHNHHVRDSVYYLNGDIFAVYYVTRYNELIVSCFDEKCFEEAICELQTEASKDHLVMDHTYQLNQSVVYEFVHSNARSLKHLLKPYN